MEALLISLLPNDTTCTYSSYSKDDREQLETLINLIKSRDYDDIIKLCVDARIVNKIGDTFLPGKL